ncbi:MAG: GIY-YIG nuclease family protein [Pseudobacteriovorax sp.]|nr:GIY-YIG nuclease family protein [Pseudobacteriovorax sp.]
MSSLPISQYIFFDCQTTSTSVKTGEMIEAAWLHVDSQAGDGADILQTAIIKTRHELPKRVVRITGIDATLMESDGVSLDAFVDRFAHCLEEHPRVPLVIHYARFETGFLADCLKTRLPNWRDNREIICTHRLSKVLVPGLGSYSLRAVAGHLGFPLAECKRAKDHLLATQFIWQQLEQKVSDSELPFASTVMAIIKSKSTVSTERKRDVTKIIDPSIRLAIPKVPGIYHFYDGTDRLLYVGKAKNLHARVNSYFRGRQTKGSKTNELLAQIKRLEVFEEETEIGALFRENQAIKRYHPPYNRVLKHHDRQFLAFDLFSSKPDPIWGQNVSNKEFLLEQCRLIIAISSGDSPSTSDSRSQLKQLLAMLRVLVEEDIEVFVIDEMRSRLKSVLANPDGYKLLSSTWRKRRKYLFEKNQEIQRLKTTKKTEVLDDSVEDDEAAEEAEMTLEELVDLMEKIIWQGLYEMHKLRWFGRLLFSDVYLQKKSQWVHCAQRGVTYTTSLAKTIDTKRKLQVKEITLDPEIWDRLNILYNQLRLAIRNGREVTVVGSGNRYWTTTDLIFQII